jgi:carboxymethylenebutenolidase
VTARPPGVGVLHAWVLGAGLLVLPGCRDDGAQESERAPATAAPAETAATAPGPRPASPHADTGMLSEEAFKALHELRSDQAPPGKGAMVEIAASKGYLSLPSAEAPLPAVIVIHEWWGLNEHIKHWSDRLAEAGYAALAVDLYGGKTAANSDEAMSLMKAVAADDAKKTLLAAMSFLAEDPRVKAKKRAAIGWCFGGKWSLELALAAPTLDAAVVYYGHVETDPARLAALEAPLLAIFGNQDESIPPKTVDRFEFGLEQAGHKRFRILRYDAPHAFANPSSARYDQASAAASWAEVQAFLAQQLK